MKKTAATLLGIILALIPALRGTAQAPVSSLLWEISGNGLKSPSYLFGTFHLICKEDFPISDLLQQKIRSSAQFYGEIAMDDPAIQMKLMSKMMMPDKNLSDLLPQKDLKQIQDNFQQITGMPLQLFNNLKPFAALSMATINSISCPNKTQPETEFAAIAKKNNLPMFGLETVEEQADILNSEPLDSQVHDLSRVLLNFDSTRQVMSQLVGVYMKRNIDSLYALMESMTGDTFFEKELVTKRNRKWVPLIEKAMADKPTFFAVGAGHLGGPEGVISLLRQRGYTVTPVKY
ncbi:MAG: TraB/GumN family protein [Chitinophagaceae bacterium]|nr:TraB/GumN family protein [Chitinophagaceae bacterium]